MTQSELQTKANWIFTYGIITNDWNYPIHGVRMFRVIMNNGDQYHVVKKDGEVFAISWIEEK